MNQLKNGLTLVLRAMPDALARDIASSEEALQKKAVLALAGRLAAATGRLINQTVPARRRRLAGTEDMPARLTELEEKLYIAIRTAPKDVLQNINHVTSAKSDDATAELARHIMPGIRAWAEQYGFAASQEDPQNEP